MSKYEGAFDCKKCPRTGDPEADRACPAWWEITGTNALTGEVKIQKDCAYRLLPTFLIEVIKASNRPAASIDRMANDILAGLEKLEQNRGPITPVLIAGPNHTFLDSGG